MKVSKSEILFYIVLLFICILKLLLVSHFQVIAIPSNTDDFHYIKLAYYVSNGQWLGPYDQYTILKNAFYSIYIGYTAKFGIPLIIHIHLLYIISGLYIILALKKHEFKSSFLIVIFILLLFNPMTHSADNFRTTRDPLFMCWNLFIIGGFLNATFLNQKKIFRALHFAITGFFIGFCYTTKEEGIWVIISASLTSVFYIFHLIREKFVFKNLIKEVLLLVLAFLVFEAVLVWIKKVNYDNYKVYRLSDIQAGDNEKTAMNYLTRLNPDTKIRNVPVLKSTRFELYDKIPTFAELRPFEESIFQGWSEERMGNPGCPEPLGAICKETTHFGWAFKNAMTARGYYASARIADAYYKKLASELKIAINEGKLKYDKPHPFQKFVPYIDINTFNFQDVAKEYIKGLIYFATMQGYDAEKCGSAQYSYGNEQTFYVTELVTNSKLKTELNNSNKSLLNSYKIRFLSILHDTYSIFTPIILIISIIIIITLLSWLLWHKKSDLLLLIGLSILLSLLIRLFMLSYLSVFGHGYFNVQYLTPSYPYIFILCAFGLYGIQKYLYKIIRFDVH